MSTTSEQELAAARRRVAFYEGILARAVAALGIGAPGPWGESAAGRIQAFERWVEEREKGGKG